MGQVTYEELINELRELRLARDKADARLLMRLVEIERDHMDVLSEAGHASFIEFVRSLRNLVDPGRYTDFKAGLAKISADEALAIGSDATIMAGRTTSEGKATEYTGAVRAWVEEHGGTQPTRQTAKHILLQVDPRRETPKAVQDQTRREDELARLRAENADLRAKLRAAESELARLRKLTATAQRRPQRSAPQPHARGRKEKPKG